MKRAIYALIFTSTVATAAVALGQDQPVPFAAPQNTSGDGSDLLAAPDSGIDSEITTGAVMTEKDMLQYCVNIQEPAREARYAFLQARLDKSKEQLEERLVLLTSRMAEIREYVERREQFLASVEEKIVGIYQAMRPDAAAEQLSELDTGLAATIIAKLDSAKSSAILTEMPPRTAAAITEFLSAATRRPPETPKTAMEPKQ